MTSLAQYDAARAALAAATRVNEVLPLREQMEHIKLHARHIQDKALLADAADIQIRAEAKLGFLLLEAEKAGLIRQGRPKKPDPENPTNSEGFTLKEIGVSHRLSADSQHKASITEQALEAMIAGVRQRIMNGRARVIEPPMPGGGMSIAHNREEASTSADFFPTPPWATRALVEHVLGNLRRDKQCKFQTVWEPACGHGHMAEPLGEYFQKVYASDLHAYGYGDADTNFLTAKLDGFDWIITNPPFGDETEKFVLRALELDITGVAMFVRLQWLETTGRYERIFSRTPPSQVAIFSERVPIHKGKWDPDGDTLTAYIWLLWIKGMPPQPVFWIPPGCAKALSKPDDRARFTQCPVERRNVIPSPDDVGAEAAE